MTRTTKPIGVIYDFDAWGPAIWTCMHVFTFNYPNDPTQEDRDRAIKFFELIPFVLPCGACGLHFVQTLHKKPLTDKVLTSTLTLSTWLNEVHNLVNERVGKPQVSYEQAKIIFLVSGFKNQTISIAGRIRDNKGFLIATITLCILLAMCVSFIIFLIIRFKKE